MRKIILSLVLCTWSLCTWSNVVVGVAAIPDGYYDGVSGKKTPAAILTALQTCISKNYNEISYKGLEPHYLNTDFYADTLWDMYSTCRFTYDDANTPQQAVCDGWNKEHVCCQSWLGSGPMVSDMFNVYPTDARINNLRSNYPYGVVGSFSGFSKDPDHHGLGKLGPSVSGAGTVYEPDDKYKGDFARTFFYMVARYRDKILNSGNGSTMFTSSPTDLTSYSLNFLLEWHRNDPVSQKEVDRNQAVYGEQNNRNPFIDYPELVEYIWGDKQGQTVDLSSMTPTCESITPTPQTTTKYGVTWMVNGVELYTDSVIAGKKPGKLPDEPQSCSQTSESFYGWAGGSWEGVLPDYLPMDIDEFSNIDYMPVIVFDVTFHAVFAHAEKEQGQGAVTATQDFSTYSRGNAVTQEKVGNVTVVFNKAGAGTATTYYEEVRCYAGSKIEFSGAQMSMIEFTPGNNDKGNALTPSTGSMTNDNKWTGNASSVTFTVGGTKGYKGIGAITVTYEDNTVVTVYSDYLTNCGTTTDFSNNVVEMPTARKVLHDGQLLIQTGDQLFNLQGQCVK